MALAKQKPGEVFYASSGVGKRPANHLAGRDFQSRLTELKITPTCRSKALGRLCRR